jgi:hypothetical protein
MAYMTVKLYSSFVLRTLQRSMLSMYKRAGS